MSRKRARHGEPPGEALCLAALACSRNMLVPWYLMGAYAYQVLDETLISDGLYDKVCVRLRDEWALVEHEHKNVVELGALTAGTSSYLSTEADYPSRVVGATHRVLRG